MTSEQLWQRSDFLGTQVITRNTGRSLGVVSELLVDIDRREVVALGLRENQFVRLFPGVPQYMYLTSIRQIGDVILVDSEDAIEDVNTEAYSSLTSCEVITETGEILGRVRGFRFNVETGKVVALVIASLGAPFIPEQVLSTYELAIEEIVSSGPDRLIVFEGAEERVVQLSVGLLERLGLGGAPWERDYEDTYHAQTVPIENQLGTGLPTHATSPVGQGRPQVVQAVRRAEPMEEVWEEDEWGAPEPLHQPVLKKAEALVYEDAQDDTNWSDDVTGDRPLAQPEQPVMPAYSQADDVNDLWADDEEPEPVQRPKINLPKKVRMPEYEEERTY